MLTVIFKDLATSTFPKEHFIVHKTQLRTCAQVAGDSDLAGPLAFCLAFDSLLLLCGKVYFNYIYRIGVMGCLAIFRLLLNLMENVSVSFHVVVSFLGHCILPIMMLSALSVFV